MSELGFVLQEDDVRVLSRALRAFIADARCWSVPPLADIGLATAMLARLAA